MPGVYDRFNKDLSNGIKTVDAGEEITAMRIIKTDLLEIKKLMEMHRQNQIKREETEAKIAKMKKYYYSEEGMEAEKAKWRQIYYSTLKEKEKVVHEEEEEESLEVAELESDDEVNEWKSEPVMEPQLPPLLSAPQLSPPPSPSLFTPALGFEKRNEATMLFMESPNQSVRKLEMPLFDDHRPPLPPPPPYPPLPLLSNFTLLLTPPSSPLPSLVTPPPLGGKNRSNSKILNIRSSNREVRKREIALFDGYRPPPLPLTSPPPLLLPTSPSQIHPCPPQTLLSPPPAPPPFLECQSNGEGTIGLTLNQKESKEAMEQAMNPKSKPPPLSLLLPPKIETKGGRMNLISNQEEPVWSCLRKQMAHSSRKSVTAETKVLGLHDLDQNGTIKLEEKQSPHMNISTVEIRVAPPPTSVSSTLTGPRLILHNADQSPIRDGNLDDISLWLNNQFIPAQIVLFPSATQLLALFIRRGVNLLWKTMSDGNGTDSSYFNNIVTTRYFNSCNDLIGQVL
ncbi:unnamed protein product [Lactuca saligna]|uniref:Uncharacterized protein n=1 Tax=Lactuca saligna TaxID=75948 RepID=A0AA35Y6T2_LACSI|nr:unnamed protein product [Lactuca saligna]